MFHERGDVLIPCHARYCHLCKNYENVLNDDYLLRVVKRLERQKALDLHKERLL